MPSAAGRRRACSREVKARRAGRPASARAGSFNTCARGDLKCMSCYVCKIATLEEMNQRWDDEIRRHTEKGNWIVWKAEAIASARAGRSIPYYGVLGGAVICEATANLYPDFPRAADRAVELCAFRTDREYRGKGYFSRLMDFLQEDLRQKGYRTAVVGVEPDDRRNRAIYRHWGFTDCVGSSTETYPDGTVIDVLFFGKQL